MLRLCLAAAIGGIAAPAPATEWGNVSGWDVYEIDATRCAVGRVFADAGMSFGAIMSIDGQARVFATSARWPTRSGQAVAAQIMLDGRVVLDGPSVGMESEGNRGFVAAADDALLQSLAGAARMTVRAGHQGPSATTALTGSAEALAQARRCVMGLRDERRDETALAVRALPSSPSARLSGARVPPARMASAGTVRAFAAPAPAAAVLAVATRAVPRASLASWVSDTEYPAAALRAGQEGATTVRIAIGKDGSVSECDVVRSSGSSALDEETCRIFKRRGRFRPALTTAGAAVDSLEQQTIRWKLPE